MLVVDDEVGIAEALRRGLTADGYTVDVADNGLDALWLASEHPYAAIVLDLMLPGMNGYKVCAELRERGVETPILMLTAKDGEYDEVEGFETGADDYMTKPFSYPVLLARLQRLVARSAGRPAGADESLQAGDLVVELRGRRVRRGDTALELSPKAFDVLVALMERAGAVVSKAELLAAAWDHAFEGDPNIVEVYVSRLRSEIDQPFGRRSIETVRGVGYRFDPHGG